MQVHMPNIVLCGDGKVGVGRCKFDGEDLSSGVWEEPNRLKVLFESEVSLGRRRFRERGLFGQRLLKGGKHFVGV